MWPASYNLFERGDQMAIRSWSMLNIVAILIGYSLGINAMPEFPQPVLDVTGGGHIFVADLNKDGIPDLVVQGGGNEGVTPDFTTISVLLGGVNGTFGPPINVTTSAPFAPMMVADINGDGNPDIVIVDHSFGNAELTVALGRGDGTFRARSSTSLNVPFGFVAFGDLNGDGKLDFVVADPSTGSLYIFLGKGDGTFQSAITVNYSGNVLSYIVLADVNHDGKLDLVGTDGSNLIVMLGNGDATFKPPVTYSGLNGAGAIAVSDINGDQYPDVVTLGKTGYDHYNVLINNGDGTFQAPTSVAFTGSNLYIGTLSLADVDGDGYPDLILLDDSNNAVYIAHNNHDGTFGIPQSYSVGSYPTSIFVADLNGDKHPDVLIGSDVVSVLFNKGDGTFPAFSSLTGSRAQDVIAVDINGDGVPDIVSTDGDDTFKVQISNGDGTFKAAQSYPVGSFPQTVVAADLNGDKYQDLIVQTGDSELQVWLNSGSGTFSLQSTIAITSCCKAPIAVADLNGDGITDIAVGTSEGISIFKGDGKGDFTQIGSINPGITVTSIAFADLNKDGHMDMVVGGSGMSIYLGNGDGTFQLKKSYNYGCLVMAVADIDGDGNPDIMCGRPGNYIFKGVGDGTFTQLPTTPAEQLFGDYSGLNAITIADVNGDGLPDVLAVDQAGVVAVFIQNTDHSFTLESAYQTGWPLNAVAVADVNGDGRADLIVATNLFTNAVEILEQTNEHAPVLSGITLNLNGSASVSGILKGSDQDGDAFYYELIAQPAHGTATVDPSSGVVTYISSSNSIGVSDSFGVAASDGTLNSKIATVNIVGSSGTGGSGSGGKSGGGDLGILELLSLLLLCLLADRRLRTLLR
jgi:FG-GAP-like repeat/Bacterial Ig domain